MIDLETFVQEIIKEHSELGKIINPLLNYKDITRKEILEACHIGKFVYKLHTECHIEKLIPPNPDFALKI